MTSARHAPVICLLLGLALIPTLIHGFASDVVTDGWATASIPTALAGHAGTDGGRSPDWGRQFVSDDWIDRTYLDEGSSVRLTVVRSYDAKSLYHHPELAIAYGTSFDGHRVQRLDARPDMPIHVLTPSPGVATLGLYVLHYDGTFVENPLSFQLRTATALLFSRRKPMTIFFALAAGVRDPVRVEALGATRVLLAAVDQFLAQVAPGQAP